jgi:tetratricopeptide (TPR) repeat protein
MRLLIVINLIALSTAYAVPAEAQISASTAANLNFEQGNIFYAANKLDEAITQYSAAINADPNYANAYYNRGNIRYIEGDLAGAYADYSQAIQLSSNLAGAYSNRGLILKLRGKVDEAINDFSRKHLIIAGLLTANWEN